jgi:hypothetical protein
MTTLTLTHEPDEYRQVLRCIAAELRVTSANEFEHTPGAPLLDEGSDPTPLRVVAAPASPPRVTRALSSFIYNHYYLGESCPKATARRMDVTTAIILREDPAFGAALREANRGHGYSDPGWRVLASESGTIVVSKNGISLRATEENIAGGHPGEVGDLVALRFPNDRPYAYPGYYMAIGNGGQVSQDLNRTIVRIYFNICSEGAPGLLSILTATMGVSLDRFSVKVLNHPESFPRPDAAIAYVLRDEFPRAWPMLSDAVRAVGDHLIARVPAFTWALAPGVALAEEPAASVPGNVSFGQHRCGLIARGLSDAFAAGAEHPAARFRYVVRKFEDASLDPARPYLNAGSRDLA